MGVVNPLRYIVSFRILYQQKKFPLETSILNNQLSFGFHPE
nr:MAG TPA: hypothetical protein [Caudoviricetes sp.]